MPIRLARPRTASSNCSGKRRLTDAFFGFNSKRITWPPERSYWLRSAAATKSSASLSVLNVGIVFFIVFHLSLVHITSTDGAQQDALAAVAQREHHKRFATLRRAPNR